MPIKKQIILYTGLFLLFFMFAPLLQNVYASDIGVSPDVESQLGIPNDLPSTFTNIVKWLLLSLAFIGVVMIIYAGVLWMTAAGNDEKVALAKKVISSVIIGLVVIFLAWAIVTFVIEGLVYGSETT